MLLNRRSNRTSKAASNTAPSSFSALISLFADIAGAMSVLFICAFIAIIMISIPLAIIMLAIIITAIIMRVDCALPSKR